MGCIIKGKTKKIPKFLNAKREYELTWDLLDFHLPLKHRNTCALILQNQVLYKVVDGSIATVTFYIKL